MLRSENQVHNKRDDKKYFNAQCVISRGNDFDKKVPTWASELNLLARVVALHYQEARRTCGDTDLRMNSLGRPKPQSYSWATLDERASTTKGSSGESHLSKRERLKRESNEMMGVLEKLAIEGKKRKAQNQKR